jgi:circadian clock protein KaiB
MNSVASQTGEESAMPGTDPRTLYSLRLYIAGQTTNSIAAIANLKRVCETHLEGRYEIEVIDLLLTPQLAAGDQILAIPTLVRRLPEPLKRIIGTLSNIDQVLVGLDIIVAGSRTGENQDDSGSMLQPPAPIEPSKYP